VPNPASQLGDEKVRGNRRAIPRARGRLRALASKCPKNRGKSRVFLAGTRDSWQNAVSPEILGLNRFKPPTSPELNRFTLKRAVAVTGNTQEAAPIRSTQPAAYVPPRGGEIYVLRNTSAPSSSSGAKRSGCPTRADLGEPKMGGSRAGRDR
jgi:hypothetical protein